MDKKHQKHTNIIKKHNDTYATNEVAILGAKCSSITALVQQVSQKLSQYKLAYLDGSHIKNPQKNTLSEFTFHPKGNVQINTSSFINKFEQRLQFSQFDYLFINGNHYQGATQILILDPEKEASIQKRIHQITNIQFIIKLDAETPFFECLQKKFPYIANITSYSIHEMDKITNHINNILKATIAPVKGLVLTGGKSTRMGSNKSELNYFGKPQKQYVKQLLESNGCNTYYSIGNYPNLSNKKTDLNGIEKIKNTNEIQDTFLNLGPFGGICSAFQKDPNSAWFVMAIDVPFVTNNLIQLLLKKRNPSKVATAIKGKGKEFPEPLIAIYEPKAYTKLLQYLAQGYSCPRKMLINSDVEIVEVADNLIRNINTLQEFKTAKKEISG